MTTKQKERKIDITIALLPMASIEKALNIKSKTLFAYEKEGILNPEIKEDKSRYYSLGDLEKARLTRILIKSKTMKLAGVKILLSVLGKANIQAEDYSNYIQNILKNCKTKVN